MITDYEILETMKMFNEQHLDIRTITMGISLMDCAASSVDECCDKIYDKIVRYAHDLVATGEAISTIAAVGGQTGHIGKVAGNRGQTADLGAVDVGCGTGLLCPELGCGSGNDDLQP